MKLGYNLAGFSFQNRHDGRTLSTGKILHVVTRTPRTEMSKWPSKGGKLNSFSAEGRENSSVFTKEVRQKISFHLSQLQVKCASKSSIQYTGMTAVLTAFLEGKGKGRTLAVRMLLATNTVLLYKRSDEYRAARCSALCRAAWGRRASNTGQDKGQRKLLWHLNWMLLLRVSQTIRLSPCAAIYSLLDLTVVQLETNV